jgi:hypothetical protein
MDRSGASGNKVFGRFAEPARQVLAARAVRSTADVGLPDGYHGAAGPLLAGLAIDLGSLRAAVAAELRGSQP